MADGTRAVVRAGSWPEPPIFDLLRRLGPVPEEEMRRTFNLGIGMVVILPAGEVERAQTLLAETGVTSWPVGEVVAGDKGVEFR